MQYRIFETSDHACSTERLLCRRSEAKVSLKPVRRLKKYEMDDSIKEILSQGGKCYLQFSDFILLRCSLDIEQVQSTLPASDGAE